MSRSSPGVRRVAAILNFIADHPGQAFALTDLVRALKLSRATCHALLTGLVDVGYLYRTSDKTYVLGPTLAAIGNTAANQFSPLQVAKPEMRRIADEFDVVCGAYFLEGDTLHLRDRAASVSHVGYPVPLGTQMKMHWTQAPVFYANSPAGVDAWLERAKPGLGEAQTQLLQQAMHFVRDNGFVVLERKPGMPFPLISDSSKYMPPEGDDMPITPRLEFAAGDSYALAAIMAPIYDAKGKVSFSLVMAGFRKMMDEQEVFEAGNSLRAACDLIGSFISGKTAVPHATE